MTAERLAVIDGTFAEYKELVASENHGEKHPERIGNLEYVMVNTNIPELLREVRTLSAALAASKAEIAELSKPHWFYDGSGESGDADLPYLEADQRKPGEEFTLFGARDTGVYRFRSEVYTEDGSEYSRATLLEVTRSSKHPAINFDCDLKAAREDNATLRRQLTEAQALVRTAWDAGAELGHKYGDNYVHFAGAQKERHWDLFLAKHARAALAHPVASTEAKAGEEAR